MVLETTLRMCAGEDAVLATRLDVRTGKRGAAPAEEFLRAFLAAAVQALHVVRTVVHAADHGPAPYFGAVGRTRHYAHGVADHTLPTLHVSSIPPPQPL